MASKKSSTLSQIERANWMIWVTTLVLVLVLTLTVYLLGMSLFKIFSEPNAETSLVEWSSFAGIGLMGLVCIFVLHNIQKRTHLKQLQETLVLEDQELKHTKARLREISRLFEVATSLNLKLPVDGILEIMARRVVAALKAQQASVMLYNPETDNLETRASYGVGGEYTTSGKVKLGHGIAGKVASEKQPLLLTNETINPQITQFYRPHRNISSALSVPLMVEGECLGVLNVNRIDHPDLFNDQLRDILKMFAEHIGAVIKRAQEVDRITLHTRELELANTKLQEMNRIKEIFLSTASHELKTPLTSIIGYAEILNEHQKKLSVDKRQEFTSRLRTEATQLLGLIEDILDLTRLETGKIQLNRGMIYLNQLVETAVETSRALAKKHKVRLIEDYQDLASPIPLDEVKIRQALVNLLVNAIKFSPEGGEVRIRTREDDTATVVEIWDQGPGVSSHESAQIFTLFGQGVRDAVRGPGGLGIGLHLVQRIVELHGGSVGVTPVEKAGSMFWIRIPKDLPAESDLAA